MMDAFERQLRNVEYGPVVAAACRSFALLADVLYIRGAIMSAECKDLLMRFQYKRQSHANGIYERSAADRPSATHEERFLLMFDALKPALRDAEREMVLAFYASLKL